MAYQMARLPVTLSKASDNFTGDGWWPALQSRSTGRWNKCPAPSGTWTWG